MKAILCFAVLVLGVALPVRGQSAARPNLAGTWKLNVAESDFGQLPPPDKQSEVFTQNGDDISIAVTIERAEMKQNYTLRFKAGGPEAAVAKDAFPADSPFRILAVKGEWQGAVLVVMERVSFQGTDGTLRASYALSADGKMLRKSTHVSMSAGEFDTKTAYDRQ
jgi:hypothetical protein